MQLAGCGISTAALAFGGDASPQAVTELWNGSSWSSVNVLNTARQRLGGAGTSTSALAMGGQPITGVTESWNGTNWTEVADLAVARRWVVGAGINNTSALAFGGESTAGIVTNTEEWNAGPTTSTIGTS